LLKAGTCSISQCESLALLLAGLMTAVLLTGVLNSEE